MRYVYDFDLQVEEEEKDAISAFVYCSSKMPRGDEDNRNFRSDGSTIQAWLSVFLHRGAPIRGKRGHLGSGKRKTGKVSQTRNCYLRRRRRRQYLANKFRAPPTTHVVQIFSMMPFFHSAAAALTSCKRGRDDLANTVGEEEGEIN